MTIPLPARAESTKPALMIVKMAKPLASSRIVRGMTPSSPLLPLSTKDSTVERTSVLESKERVEIRAYSSRLFAFLWKGLRQWITELHGEGER